MYLLEVDEAMPFEGADFSRSILGLATDPTSYLGGAGLLARVGGKLAGKNLARQALIRAGASGKFGATFGAGYGGLYDIGMQTVEKQGGRREEYDPARFGKAAAAGGILGYTLGAATGLAPEVVRATSKWFKGFQAKNAKRMSAADEFRNVPDNVSNSIDVRRNMADNKKLIAQANEEVPQDINDWVSDLLDENQGMSSKDIIDTMGETLNLMMDDAETYGLTELDMMKFAQIDRVIRSDSKAMVRIVDNHRKNQMKVIEGSATEKGEGGTTLELVPTKEELDAKFYKEMGESIDANTADADKAIRDAFEKFDRYDRANPPSKDKPRDYNYNVIADPDDYQVKPDLKVITNDMADLAQIAVNKDSTLSANMERAIMGEELIKPNYKKKPDFLKGSQDDLVERITEYDQLIKTQGEDTFKGKELKFFLTMLEEELAKRRR